MKKPTLEKAVLFAFIAVESVIYVAFNVMAAVGAPDPIYLKYAGVLLCAAASAALVFLTGGGRDCIVLVCALLFTAVSDLFILVLGKYYEIGLVTFIIAQSVYFYRLYAGRLRKIFISLAARVAVAAVLITVLAAVGALGLLVAECAIYITMLAGNLADAFVVCRNGVKNVLFAVGLLLFLGCDVCVGLYNAGSALALELPEGVVGFASYGMWAFYLPSQVLITCSYTRCGLNARRAVPVGESGATGGEGGE